MKIKLFNYKMFHHDDFPLSKNNKNFRSTCNELHLLGLLSQKYQVENIFFMEGSLKHGTLILTRLTNVSRKAQSSRHFAVQE